MYNNNLDLRERVMTLLEKFLHKKNNKWCYSPKQIRFVCWWAWGWGVLQNAGYVTYPGLFEDKWADNLNFRFQNQGYFQGISVTIATCSLKTTSSGAGYVPGLVHFRAISACVIYWRAFSGCEYIQKYTGSLHLKTFEYHEKGQYFFWLISESETHILYRFITHRVKYAKPLFLEIWMIMAYR